jgi:hypothetical protein
MKRAVIGALALTGLASPMLALLSQVTPTRAHWESCRCNFMSPPYLRHAPLSRCRGGPDAQTRRTTPHDGSKVGRLAPYPRRNGPARVRLAQVDQLWPNFAPQTARTICLTVRRELG